MFNHVNTHSAMKLQGNSTGSGQIENVRFHQVFRTSQFLTEILEPVLMKLSQLAHDNRMGIFTLEMVVMMSCIILGITILMVIKQEVFSKLSANEEPPPRTESPVVPL